MVVPAAFLDIKYWFNPNPIALGPSLVGGMIFFFAWFLVGAVVCAIGARMLRDRDMLKADITSRFVWLLLTTGLLGLMFLFFSYEQIPLFGMRFWFLVTFIVFIIWLTRIAIYIARDVPALRETQKQREQIERYLPKHKK